VRAGSRQSGQVQSDAQFSDKPVIRQSPSWRLLRLESPKRLHSMTDLGIEELVKFASRH
jgi:hypothetical protein